jgi:uncharacterized RDD family membrane protein YckC
VDDGIVIGEGVVLDARPASFATRMLGALLDVTVQVAVLLGLLWVTTGALDLADGGFTPALRIATLVVVMVVVPTTVETLSRGRSLGKLLTGIRVVRDDGGPVRLRHAFIRSLVGIGELWFTLGSVALIASLTNTRGKRIGDMLAGTYAIRIRGGRVRVAPVLMPPHLAAWAASSDMRRLPDGLALACRQFLARTQKLHPTSRARVGGELAAQVERFVAPSPPAGTHPEAFLMAVLHERRDREWRRARRAQALAAEQAEMVQRLPYSIPDPTT